MADKMIYQRLSNELKEKIRLSEKKIKDNIYCWSLDPEDGWSGDRIDRDTAARIYAFGEMTSTLGQVTSMNKEASLSEKGKKLVDTELQAQPFKAG